METISTTLIPGHEKFHWAAIEKFIATIEEMKAAEFDISFYKNDSLRQHAASDQYNRCKEQVYKCASNIKISVQKLKPKNL